MKRNLLIIIHFLLTILAWTSFLYVSWKYIALISLVHIVMLEVNDGCFLSHMQFNDKTSENTSFYEWWMIKLGIRISNRDKLKIFMRYCVPLILVLLGIIFQDIIGLKMVCIFKISMLS